MRLWCGDSRVARHGDLEPAAECEVLDGGDGWFGTGLDDGVEDCVEVGHVPHGPALGARLELGDVEASGELAAGAGDDDGADAGIGLRSLDVGLDTLEHCLGWIGWDSRVSRGVDGAAWLVVTHENYRKRANRRENLRVCAPGTASALTGGLLMEITATPSLTSMDTGESRAMGGRDVVCAAGVGYIRTRLGRVNLRDDEASVSEPTNRRIFGHLRFWHTVCLCKSSQTSSTISFL